MNQLPGLATSLLILSTGSAFALEFKLENGTHTWHKSISRPYVMVMPADEFCTTLRVKNLPLYQAQMKLFENGRKYNPKTDAALKKPLDALAQKKADEACQWGGHPDGAASFSSDLILSSIFGEVIDLENKKTEVKRFKAIDYGGRDTRFQYKRSISSPLQCRHLVLSDFVCKGPYDFAKDMTLSHSKKVGMRIKGTVQILNSALKDLKTQQKQHLEETQNPCEKKVILEQGIQDYTEFLVTLRSDPQAPDYKEVIKKTEKEKKDLEKKLKSYRKPSSCSDPVPSE